MIDKQTAKKQLARITRMRKFPDTPEGVNDMICALQVATTEEMAKACLDDFLETATSDTYCPMPAQIRGWINERQAADDTEQKRRTRDCAICGGLGEVFVQRGPYSGSKPCECRKSGGRSVAA